MLPGSRQQSMGNSATALIDESHAVFANPASGGLLREWYWSASYCKWIADVYNASLIAGKSLATPWSNRTLISAGVLYQGVGEFDSSDRTASPVSANDMVLALNLGQPLTFLTQNLSIGVDVKYLASKLAQYDANTWVFDTGALYRTPRFKLSKNANGLFPYGILSAGVSVTNMGEPLTFIRQATPLPKEVRAGLAFYAGRHNGLQLQLAADYHDRRDEGSHMAFGAELAWNNRFAINAGFDNSNDLLDKYSLGFSIGLDDQSSILGDRIPGHNNAMRMDLASMNEREFFHLTYRGTASHYPIGPEAFEFATPYLGSIVYSDSVMLSCRLSRDPDLYDDLHYMILMDQDSVKLANKIAHLQQNASEFMQATHNDLMLSRQELGTPVTQARRLTGGDYYWAAVAYDQDHHLRFAKKKDHIIASFYVPYPDLVAEEITFTYDPWITQDDYHGKLRIRFANQGEHWAKNVQWTITDSLASPLAGNPPTQGTVILKSDRLPVLLPGEERIVELDWNTNQLGRHLLRLDIQSTPSQENRRDNNHLQKFLYTIPKGRFFTADTAQVITAVTRSFAIPIITEVCFDTNGTRVKDEYLLKKVIEPPLDIISRRMVQHRDIKIHLQGFIDPNSGETELELANRRSQAVRDTLIHKGVRPEQIEILPGIQLARRYIPANPQDARWVFEERRYVKITTDSTYVPTLFAPLNYVDVENTEATVLFDSQIRSAVAVDEGIVRLHVEAARDSFPADVSRQTLLQGVTTWSMPVHDYFKVNPWLNQPTQYAIQLKDSLGRTFKTHPKTFLPTGKAQLGEHTVAFPLQFNKSDPLYSFYWANILESIEELLTEPSRRFRFLGHACAIGAAPYNLRLSDKRAKSFHDGFLDYMKEHYPEGYQLVLTHTDEAKGYGESKPLGVIRSNSETIIIGDNNLPTGRKLNRRIEIYFYIKK
jgi:outer membrane protein OmpA-like peptidoglycan-associated protein